VGFSLTRPSNRKVELPSGSKLDVRELEAVPTMATLVRTGPAWTSHTAFGAIGAWIEANGFQLAGPCREVFLDAPFEGASQPVIEIQFPVQPAV
jgi:effector-binding domain-containing protein